MEREIAAKFEETKKTFETSLLEAQDKAKKAQDAEAAATAKVEDLKQ